MDFLKAMILGWITRRQYLEHHDPERWVVGGAARPEPGPADTKPQPI